ncbi:hypothetical protein F4802DRAFT_603980 [Xylaria palmicola]|nr:hypothetical protein F4802DRAFT_603980 [Xylaria palmicola]
MPFASWQSLWGWWWWWEILALVICIGATVGLVQWLLPIQPNSVISILTTVSKTAMLVPAASCLSQLKWHHFSRRPQRLTDLQLFDSASRGPWGSVLFLFQLPRLSTAFLSVGFAVLTIVALGIDPSAQQILAFPVHEAEITTNPVVMGRADAYTSGSYNDPNVKLFTFQYAVLDALRGSTIESYYTCPNKATRCTWGDLTTLGVCSSWNKAQVSSDSCEMISAQTPAQTPEMDNATYANCKYTLSNQDSGNAELASAIYPTNLNLTFRVPSLDVNSGNKVFESDFIAGPYKSETEFGEFFALKAPANLTSFQSQEDFKAPDAEAFYASFWWCSQTLQGITAGSQGVNVENTSWQRLIQSGNRTGAAGVPFIYITQPSGLNYTIEAASYELITSYISQLLRVEAFDQFSDLSDETYNPVLAVGRLLYETHLANMTENLSSTLTNVIRSTSFNENANATNINGKAFFNEGYIQVRWIWLLVPLLETALITLLLGLSIFITVKEPLIKDNVLAYLSTTVENRTRSGSELLMTPWTTEHTLNNQAEDIIVKLEPDKQGQLRFFKQNTRVTNK